MNGNDIFCNSICNGIVIKPIELQSYYFHFNRIDHIGYFNCSKPHWKARNKSFRETPFGGTGVLCWRHDLPCHAMSLVDSTIQHIFVVYLFVSITDLWTGRHIPQGDIKIKQQPLQILSYYGILASNKKLSSCNVASLPATIYFLPH